MYFTGSNSTLERKKKCLSTLYKIFCTMQYILRGGIKTMELISISPYPFLAHVVMLVTLPSLQRNTGELVKWKQRLHCRNCVSIAGSHQRALF